MNYLHSWIITWRYCLWSMLLRAWRGRQCSWQAADTAGLTTRRSARRRTNHRSKWTPSPIVGLRSISPLGIAKTPAMDASPVYPLVCTRAESMVGSSNIRVVSCRTSSGDYYAWQYYGRDHRAVKLFIGRMAANPGFGLTYDEALIIFEYMDYLDAVMDDGESASRCG